MWKASWTGIQRDDAFYRSFLGVEAMVIIAVLAGQCRRRSSFSLGLFSFFQLSRLLEISSLPMILSAGVCRSRPIVSFVTWVCSTSHVASTFNHDSVNLISQG
ncbi:hypothetical protein J3459_010747 [Metarhizium acridum]|uniref:uncharacterized protein n=1 Tax=Metarhizium acridum TaxID=92637 RepID=UPI001C6AB73E|nr:hypothetical protein J3458_019874 [Metarhizium acridum]KAG8422031.1 hypothetical protein J3459_010747 [Metarhizium acridum]